MGKIVFLNLDSEGYLLSVCSLPQNDDIAETQMPSMNLTDDYDFSGVRINAYYWDGEALVLDEDRLAELETEQQQAEREFERNNRKSFARSEITDAILTAAINTLDVDDNTALRWIDFYPEWSDGAFYSVGIKVQSCDRLWRCRQDHTSQTGWDPQNAPALWEEVCESHSGSIDDPIPYNNNMQLDAGKYYSQDGIVYLCIRDTGVPVYNNLADLVGLYVELA